MTPQEVILGEFAQAYGEFVYLNDLFDALPDKGCPRAKSLLRVRCEAMERVAECGKLALAAGVEERRVRLAEKQGALIGPAVRSLLDDLGSDREKP